MQNLARPVNGELYVCTNKTNKKISHLRLYDFIYRLTYNIIIIRWIELRLTIRLSKINHASTWRITKHACGTCVGLFIFHISYIIAYSLTCILSEWKYLKLISLGEYSICYLRRIFFWLCFFCLISFLLLHLLLYVFSIHHCLCFVQIVTLI